MAKAFPRRNYDGAPRKATMAKGAAAPTAWEAQAGWYDQHQGDQGDDLYRQVLLPCVLRRLGAKPGQTVLDLGCGQGVLGRALASLGVSSLGIDASPALVQAAQARAGKLERHVVGDIRRLASSVPAPCDHAVLLMVLQDLDPIEPVLEGVAAALKPGGRLVVVLTHPCFRAPRRSGWGWDDEQRAQYRRIDGYLSPYQVSLATHPGAAAGTVEAQQRTSSFHRPISEYLNALGLAGLPVIACDELCNPRRGTKGTRFIAEDRAAHEIPLFLALTAQRVRLGGPAS